MDYPTEEELAEMNGMDEFPSQKTPTAAKNNHSFFQNATQLSQITVGSQDHSNFVNRRLFGTPTAENSSQRMASTPYAFSATPANRFEYPNGEHNPRKRRLDDLFGDIGDIIDEENVAKVYYGYGNDENERKKAKCEEEMDLHLIERILAARALQRVKVNNHGKKNKLEQLEFLRNFKKRNLSEICPNWPSIPVIGQNADRIYVRMHSEEFEIDRLKEIDFRNGFNNLLGENSDSVWNKAQQIIEIRTRIQTETVLPLEEADEKEIVSEKSDSDQLWVEKYKPRSYFDLLSDESTNRSLLTWLKMWDKIVFHREFITHTKTHDGQKSAGSNFNKKTGRFEVGGVRFRKGRHTDLKTEFDSYGRPVQKIAVLCGPPGLGKTTLAHTIAHHAGYTVREINASDDRSPESFRLALQNGTEMQTTLLDRDHRPNCIILDEIDGAPTASIDFLIRFISDPKDIRKDATGKPKKKTKSGILRRPIICICNDIYTPSLRALRQTAFIVTFPSLESARLAERLFTICRKEKLQTDMTALLALVDKTSNDVRSCISLLQFYANTNKPLTLIDVLKSNIGQKDKHKGLFEIWSTIFNIQRPKCNAIAENGDANSSVNDVAICDNSLKTRVDNVLGVVHNGGNYDRLVNGVHENYLNQKMPDPNMYGIAEATNWFVFTDQLQSLIQSQQNYSIYPYLSHGFAAWHLLFATLTWPHIVFPTKSFEFYQKTIVQHSIRTSFMKKNSVTVRSLANNSVIVISEAVPYIRQVITPSLRSVSLQLLAPKERCDLHHTVEVMADLGLSYVQLKNVDGTYSYQLEPDIHELCNLKAVPIENELTYSNMQIIAREVDLEIMRRITPRNTEMATDKKNTKNKPKEFKKPNHLQRLETKPMKNQKAMETVYKDFFGRVVTKQNILTKGECESNLIVQSPIWYRYKEGFNNAVRKDITMKNLM